MTMIPTYRGDVLPLLKLGLPLVGSSVAGFAIHMTDTFMLGWYSIPALASVGLAGTLYFNVYILGAGFGFAVMPLVAAATAEGDDTQARRATRMAMWLSVLFVLMVLPLMWWSDPVLRFLGQEDNLSELSQQYLRIAGVGMLPALLVTVLRSYLSAQHRTSILLWVTLGSVFLNAAVNYVLIFGNFGAPELGVRGAAIASVSVQAVTLLFLAVYAHLIAPDVRLFQRLWKPDSEAMARVFKLGLPIGLTSLAETGLFGASSMMMGWIGENELAAHGIALQLAALAFMFHVGMSQAATIRAGGAYGRRDGAELRRTALAAIGIGLSFGVVVVTVFLWMPEVMVGMFIDPSDPRRDAVVAIGASLVMMAALFQFVDAGQSIAISLLRGAQDTNVPMWLATISYWIVGMPASYLFAFTLGWAEKGLWLGLTVGLGVAAVTLMWRFWGNTVKIG